MEVLLKEIYMWSLYATDFCHRKWMHKEKSILLFYWLFTIYLLETDFTLDYQEMPSVQSVSSASLISFQKPFEWILAHPVQILKIQLFG